MTTDNLKSIEIQRRCGLAHRYDDIAYPLKRLQALTFMLECASQHIDEAGLAKQTLWHYGAVMRQQADEALKLWQEHCQVESEDR